MGSHDGSQETDLWRLGGAVTTTTARGSSSQAPCSKLPQPPKTTPSWEPMSAGEALQGYSTFKLYKRIQLFYEYCGMGTGAGEWPCRNLDPRIES